MQKIIALLTLLLISINLTPADAPKTDSRVQLVAITPDAEQTMAFITRVSNPGNQNNTKFAGLLRTCLRDGHWSVFEHATTTWKITSYSAIITHIVRHRSLKISSLKSNPDYSTNTSPISTEILNELLQAMAQHNQATMELYREMLKHLIAKECARFILPKAVLTRLYLTGDITEWINFFTNIDPDLQQNSPEEYDIIQQCKAIFCNKYPNTAKKLSIQQPSLIENASSVKLICHTPLEPNECSDASLLKHENMTMEINTTIGIADEILLKNPAFTVQQFSQRYANVDALATDTSTEQTTISAIPLRKAQQHDLTRYQQPVILPYELRRQDPDDRQNSFPNLPQDLQDYFQRKIALHNQKTLDLHKRLFTCGIHQECADQILPQAHERTILLTGRVRDLIHYIETRTHKSTQKEHRDVALEIQAIFNQHFPVIKAAIILKQQAALPLALPAAPQKEA